jgi:hypothetical protein
MLFLAFGNIFLRQELQDHTSFTLKSSTTPLLWEPWMSLQVEQHAMDATDRNDMVIFGIPKKQTVGIYWVATHHRSELGWVPGNSLWSFEVQILSVLD